MVCVAEGEKQNEKKERLFVIQCRLRSKLGAPRRFNAPVDDEWNSFL